MGPGSLRMEKRLFIAVFASIAFLLLWGAVLPRLFPQLAKPKPTAAVPSARSSAGTTPSSTAGPMAATTSPVTTSSGAPTFSAPLAPAVIEKAPSAIPAIAATSVIRTIVETPEYAATFSNRGAQLVSFVLKGYKDLKGHPVDLVKQRPASRSDFPFMLESPDTAWNAAVNRGLWTLSDQTTPSGRTLEYTFADGRGTAVTKRFVLTRDYLFQFEILVQNATFPYRVTIGPGIRTFANGETDNQFVITGNGVIQRDGSFKVVAREKAPALKIMPAPVDYVGVEDNYFLTAIKPKQAGEALFRVLTVRVREGSKDHPRTDLYASVNSVDGAIRGGAFFGPKEAGILEQHGLEKTLKFGMFGIIANILLKGLVWIYALTKNYGWAIIVLTIVIKILLFPLQHKSLVSMKKMQKVQPKMTALRDKYKKAKTDVEQRQKMNVEMMKLYQEEGISPMSGCLPLLLQLPILWAFYNLLSNAIELRGADFMGWINDLSVKDPYYITPILMTLTMYIQQKMAPATMDPAQRKIFMIMPFIFGWIFKEFPSGLVLYWLVQNVLTIAQQMIMNRYWKDHPVELAK